MSLLAIYLMRAILTSTVLVMLVLLALAGLFEFIRRPKDILVLVIISVCVRVESRRIDEHPHLR